jgi:hypothetical protein
MFFFFFPLKL